MPRRHRRQPTAAPQDTIQFQAGSDALVAAGDLALGGSLTPSTGNGYVVPWSATIIQLIGWKGAASGAADLEVLVNGAEVAQLAMEAGDRNKRADVSVDVAQDDLVRFRSSAALLGGGGLTAILRRRE